MNMTVHSNKTIDRNYEHTCYLQVEAVSKKLHSMLKICKNVIEKILFAIPE